MHMHLGALGRAEVLRAPAAGTAKLDAAKRRDRAGPALSLESAAFPEAVFPGRPPRIATGSSEIIILDGRGRILAVNQAWRETIAAYGCALRNAGIGARYVEVARRFLPDLDRAALELSLRHLLSGCVDDIRRTYAIPTAHGLGWRHVQITPLSVGTTGRFVAIHDDMTELAQAQEALQVSSEQILTARDEERQRIAIELHDSTSQHLAAINLSLARLRR
jgi:signal transduction histidine kinase